MQFSSGLSLLELLIVLTVTCFILMFGIPSFSEQSRTIQVKTAADSLVEAMASTRLQAVTANKRATLSKLGNQWSDGWEMFIDHNNDGQLNNDETVFFRHEKLTGVRISTNKPVKDNVSYVGSGESRVAAGNDGGGFQAGTFVICPLTQGDGYKLILSRGGRVRVANTSLGDCEP
jgi:type IV fimbrial biogenesis protein FimT